MTNGRLRTLKAIVDRIPSLSDGQLHWLERVLAVFAAESHFALSDSDLFDKGILENFGDALRIHHSFSMEPFSKDKFEYVLCNVLILGGHAAVLAPKGNRGHDLSIGQVKLSLKTQADKDIRLNRIWISKFMELGKGEWGDNPSQLQGLLDQFINHLASYDRILVLRTLSKAPNWKYELVEIPKSILLEARNGLLEMMLESKQYPKPGYCRVYDNQQQLYYELYFDGGSERKLQIKSLDKSICRVHATWDFTLPD